MSQPNATPRGAAPSTHLVGRYQLEGAPDSGPIHIEWRGAFLHVSGAREGIGMTFAGRLVIAFAPPTPAGEVNVGERVEIGAYDVRDGEAHGLWVPPAASQADYSACGVEVSAVDAAQPGVWIIRRAVAIDGSAYAGRVSRKAMGPAAPQEPTAVEMNWDLEDGQFRSFGLDYGDAVYSTYCLEPGKTHGVAAYEAGAPAMNGWSLVSGEREARRERLRRV